VLLLAGLYCVLGAVAVTMWLWRTRRRASWRPILVFPVRRHGDRALPAPRPDHRGDERPAGRQDHVEHLHAAARRAAHPATLLAGPQVSLTVLFTAGFAGSAFTMFTVLRRWDVSVPAAGLGVAVVGLYMSPPEHALVLAVDQKSPIRALERTAPCLLMLPTTPERRRHDCVRHGTTRRTWT
jgi:hypothetical protein